MSNSQIGIGAALLTWLAVIAGGMSYLAYYDQQAGPAAAAPFQIAPLAASVPQKQRLLMFVHPRCPCSTASLRELERLMPRCVGEVDATVYFIRPENEPDSWAHGNLWDLVKQIPGTRAEIDTRGKLAERFAATTSGSIVVYDAAGQLQYQGGITVARGHEGDSRGKAAIFALAHGEANDVAECPVYGCPLRGKANSEQLDSEKYQ
jgi:hypothetical protein